MTRRIRAQALVELKLTLRRGESVLVAIGIPVGILVFFTLIDVLPHPRGRVVDFLVPGVLALSVISSAMTSLSIATGFERQSGVLRRLGTTPLGRSGLLVAKLAALGAVIALQVVATVAVGYALHWRPHGGELASVGILILGVAAFAGLGFTLAGRLRAETNLAAANGLFLLFLLFGGIIVPISRLPGTIASFAQVLPAEPLAAGLRSALAGRGTPMHSVVTLAVWAVATTLVAVTSFRWD